MGCRILHDPAREAAVYYDSVTGVSFGELFSGADAQSQAEHFLVWLGRRHWLQETDPRAIPLGELSELRREWRKRYWDPETGMLTDEGVRELADAY